MVKFLFSMILCSLLHLPPAAFLSLSVDDHMLFPNQTLVDNGQTLVSRNQVFEMDFFSPGKSSSRFLGIWYTNTPEVVVCVANGINPISASQAPVFLVSRTGNLVLTSGKGITWSMNSSGMATNPVLHLLDFGNLVLEKCRDECLKNCSCTADKGCLTCFGELVDARGLSSGEINHEHCPHLGILHAVDNTGSEKETEKKRTMKLMLISIASGVLVSAIIINGGLHFTARRKSRAYLFLTTVLCSLLKLALGVADNDMLLPNQTLSTGQTLVSRNRIFEMGFFSPGRSFNRFLGIWYKNTPEVVVWVANRNNPVSASQAPVFAVSRTGNLVVSSGESIIWSVNSSAKNPFLQLLDSGNLVLVDDNGNNDNNKDSSTTTYMWQSFHYPTDTMLPGMEMVDDVEGGVERYLSSWRNADDPSNGDYVIKIHNHGLADLVVLRGKTKRHRQGQWNGAYFGGAALIPASIYNPVMVFKQERLVTLRDPYQTSLITRISLDSSGAIVRHHMNTRRDKWTLAFTFPRDKCDEYGSCGPNTMCRSDRPIQCRCLEGFAPKFRKDWDILDWSSGCERITPLNCHGGDGFVEIRGVKYPDMLSFQLNTSMSLGECRDACLKKCICAAYANPFITDGGKGCLMWSGDLIDARQLSEADGKQNIYIRVSLSEIDKNTGSEEVVKNETERKRTTKLILISIASGVLVSAIINGGLHYMARRKGQVRRNDEDPGLPPIRMATIRQATNDFCKENIIGVGGFGPVFKGKMPSGEEIAVKRLSSFSQQGFEEFRNEMLIAKLQHRNLIRLLGCCVEGDERMLVYEYVHNKSLDYFVFDQNRRTLLTWPKRYDIIIGISRGLLYLHHDSRLKIIHRDLKTSNILLDENLNPKISDFGLARIFEENQSLARTRRVVGTYGYMSPEYAIDGKFSEKSDIFSLGVVLLEIISGEKNRGYGDSDCYFNLLGNAWLLWKKNNILELMDECLNDTFVESQVKRCIQVGLLCVQRFAEDRPTTSSVVSMLGSDEATLPEPKEPGFFMERSCKPVRSSTLPYMSENEITITDLEAR